MNRFTIACLVCFLFVQNSSFGWSQEQPSLSIDTDTEEVFVGESLRLRISLNNMEGVAAPKLERLQRDFAVELLGESPMSQSSTTFINGRLMQRNLYRVDCDYQLTPKRKGTLTIPSIAVEYEGKKYTTEPLEIRVLEPEPQDFVFVETNVSKKRIYPTERFDVTLRVLVRSIPDWEEDPLRPLARRPPRLTIPWIETPDGMRGLDQNQWLQTLLSDRNYGFTINGIRTSSAFLFEGPQAALFDLLTGKTTKVLENGEEHEFFVYEITKSLQADTPGNYSFGPAMVKGVFAVGREDDKLLAKQIAATASPVSVEVVEVPTPRPSNYFGGIGNYSVSTSISPNQCRVGDPLTLTLTIESEEASLEPVFAPKLASDPTLSESFEIIDDAPIGRMEGTKKVFAYSIRPKKVIDTIPPLPFQTFDPKAEKFIEITGNPMTIQVEEGAFVSLANTSPARSGANDPLSDNPGDIVLGTSQSHPVVLSSIRTGYLVAAVGASWLASLAVLGFFKVRSSVRSRVANRQFELGARVQTGMRQAEEAWQRGEVDEACRCIHRQFAVILAGPKDQSCDGMTTLDILQRAQQRGLGDETIVKLKDLLGKLDERRFSFGMAADDRSLIESAVELQQSLLEHRHRADSKPRRSGAFLSWLPLFLLTLIASPSFASSSEDAANWEQLIARLSQSSAPADWEAIANEMERLCREGEPNANAYFHQGNAWFRVGDFGRAIHAYRIANRIAPNDQSIARNLQTARDASNASSNPKAKSDSVFRWSLPLDWYWKRNTAAILLFIAAPLLSWGILASRRRPLAISVVFGLFGILLSIDAFVESPSRFASAHGVVIRESKAYVGMSESSAEAWNKPLPIGAEVEILQQTPSWVLARFPDRGEAWVKSYSVRSGR